MDGRIRVMGVPIDALTMEQTVDKILGHIERGERYSMWPSTRKGSQNGRGCSAQDHQPVRGHSGRCDWLCWSANAWSTLPERVAGIDLMDGLIRPCRAWLSSVFWGLAPRLSRPQ